MGINARRAVVAASFLSLSLVAGFYLGWFDRGYGKVSKNAYEFSKALLSACLNRNEEHLGKVERLLMEADRESLPDRERLWLEKIVKRARSGDWEYAAKDARRMMVDQARD